MFQTEQPLILLVIFNITSPIISPFWLVWYQHLKGLLMVESRVWNQQRRSKIVIWWFPEIGVPPNHPFLDGIFPNKNHPYWGSPIYGTPHFMLRPTCFRNKKSDL